MMDNLDKFQKLVATDWEISILIGLDCQDLQAYFKHKIYNLIKCHKYSYK
jgi:hypothetical protein